MAGDLDELAAALPEGRVVTDPDVVGAYSRDHAEAVAPPGRGHAAVSYTHLTLPTKA